MSVNASISLGSTFHCYDSRAQLSISTVYTITKASLLLPLSSLVLYLGLQRWRQQRSFDTTSHSDIITYNVAAMQLISILGDLVFLCGAFTRDMVVLIVGFYTLFLVYPGQMLFHVLTCVERYLAVVHPVTYMGLRQSGGARIRNISICCVWLLSFGCSASIFRADLYYNLNLTLLGFSLIIVSFCSLRVLCVLIRPGPGEVGGARERVDQSKQRAFYTMMVITAVLLVWFSGFIVCISLYTSQLLSVWAACLVMASVDWFVLPSGLVLPLLLLHRAGKLTCCCLK